MGYTLGQAARAVGMSKTSIFRSIKAGRISGTKDEFGQWCIEPCELHRVYPALTDVTDSDSTAEQAVTGSETGGDTAFGGCPAFLLKMTKRSLPLVRLRGFLFVRKNAIV
jgi:hypothetical protein